MNSTTPSLAITWQQPTFLLPLFCLCSLLGVSNSVADAIGLSLTVCVAVTVSAVLIALLGNAIAAVVDVIIWLLIGGAVIAVIELLSHAAFYGLYRTESVFLPLAVLSCLLLARHEMRHELNSPWRAVRRAVLMSAGFMLAAVVLSAGRELVGRGSLFYDAEMIFGEWARPLSLQLFRADRGFLLALLAPGAFIALGIGVALYNWLWLQLSKRRHFTPHD